ncbi:MULTISPECIES: amino acid ABC transporter substrate-binding protein [Tatumella]|uniref:Amino acid ABC transporter substrate-binding protein n=1 Tax=Tatumella punctata TaxID=399969 RepID=A0ABW1VQE9_9GAMM|nr:MULTISPECIES: amino acid ABC transporter substrate-binding protein [unclassified Tatumella]MBS0857287.1 amino acid ABC transporter substrate-binding protein [Tatumella sp. JGM16]MBS0878693.1 amino acid ABC transporter substrate-binding protein [Tatumella sp. JGM82]MBS0891863.1 amino acid ABC transporter substrate-binding protein [Tatumella sp. JGM94]MBS0894897.1 amino acid ABC transporter substrate-binding protein [Tatumella sp. JGM130]MBS0903286.1 amino acid ABC transporter substrate-bindi
MKKTTLLLSALFSLSVAHSALADDSLAQVKSSGELKIGTEGTYPPFTFHTISGDLTGFDVEIGRAIAQQLHVKPVFVEGKWDGLIAGLDAKRYDVVMNEVGISPERGKKYDFSQPYIASKAVVVVKNDNDSIHDFSDLKGKKSAQSLTSNYAQIARNYGAQLVSTDGFNQSIDLVVQGRADATVNDKLSFLDFKKHRPDAPVKIVASEDNASASAVLLRKGETSLQTAINDALTTLKKDGTYQKISEKYFGEDVSH